MHISAPNFVRGINDNVEIFNHGVPETKTTEENSYGWVPTVMGLRWGKLAQHCNN